MKTAEDEPTTRQFHTGAMAHYFVSPSDMFFFTPGPSWRLTFRVTPLDHSYVFFAKRSQVIFLFRDFYDYPMLERSLQITSVGSLP